MTIIKCDCCGEIVDKIVAICDDLLICNECYDYDASHPRHKTAKERYDRVQAAILSAFESSRQNRADLFGE